jgi:hypothetical protein
MEQEFPPDKQTPWARIRPDIGGDHPHPLVGKSKLSGDLSPHEMRHLRGRPDGKNVGFGLDPGDDAAAFERRGAVAMMAIALAQRKRRSAERFIDVAFRMPKLNTTLSLDPSWTRVAPAWRESSGSTTTGNCSYSTAT